jgi:hypothetical protein
MNRLDEIMGKMEQCITTLQLLEQEYKDKKRGQIYFSTKNYNLKKVEALRKELINFGSVTILEWSVTYNQEPFIYTENTETIKLQYAITEQEIKTYYEKVLKRNVIKITQVGVPITCKFPSKK